MSTRQFPLDPSSALKLVIGDLIGVPTDGGRWGCLQVTDLDPGKRSVLWAGVLDWTGNTAPTPETTTGCAIMDNKMTRIELFTHGGLQVYCNRPVIENGHASNRGVYEVGTVHAVSGWMARMRAAAERAEQ